MRSLKVVRYGDLIQGDEEAFSYALAVSVAYGEATFFEKGEIVYLVEAKVLWAGIVQVRREGETTKYWTAMEAIE